MRTGIVAAVAASSVLTGCSSVHPLGCERFHEGPAFLVAPAVDPKGQTLEVLVGTPFQTVTPSSEAADGASADNDQVLHRQGVSHHDGRTATLFTALHEGRTLISVPGKVHGRSVTLRMRVAVVCTSRAGIPDVYRFRA